MDYISEVLNLQVTYTEWAFTKDMPYLISDRYEIRKVTIGSAPALLLKLKAEFPPISTLQKHIARIQKVESVPAILELDSISRYRRDALIKAGIPFVVPGKQLYLPFLGAVLSERFDPEPVETEKLLPSAQVLFFYYLYSKQDRIHMSSAVKELQYSAMSISRAAKQLVQTELFEEHKEGVQKTLIAKHDRKEMFNRMQSHLITPVKRRMYISKELVPADCMLAGYSAMAQYSMLNEPAVSCYATDCSAKLNGNAALANAETQAEVEIWKYDPGVLSFDHMVDPLSLVMSLQENMDERTEEAIEELLEKFWED